MRLVAAVMESSRDPGEDRIIGTLEISGKTTFERTSQSTKFVPILSFLEAPADTS